MPFSKDSLTGEWAVDTNGDLVPIDGDPVAIEDVQAASRLGVPVYSDDANAPTSSEYFNETDNQMKYKDSAGTVHSAGSGTEYFGPTEYVVGGSESPYQSFQAAVDASPNFARIELRENYDPANDTFPVSVNSETIVGAGRNATMVDVADTAVNGIECISDGTRGPTIKDLTVKGAQWGIYVEGAPISVFQDLYITNCEGGMNVGDNDAVAGSPTSHHCHFQNIRVRDFSDAAGTKAAFFGYAIHNSQFDKFSGIYMLRGMYVRTSVGVTFNSIDCEHNAQEGAKFLELYGSNFNSCYFERNSTTEIGKYPAIFFQNSSGNSITASYFNGKNQERAGIDTQTDKGGTGGEATAGTHSISVRNCSYFGYDPTNAGVDGFINISVGPADDWDLHLNSHVNAGEGGNSDSSQLVGDVSGGGRVRSNGLIIGTDGSGTLNGFLLVDGGGSIQPGAYAGDMAVAAGGANSAASQWDFAIWDGTNWNYYSPTGTA